MNVSRCPLEGAPSAPLLATETLASVDVNGGWVQDPLIAAPDHATVALQRFDGFEIRSGTQTWSVAVRVAYHNAWWSPDSKRLAFHVPTGLALFDRSDPGTPEKGKTRVVFTPAHGERVASLAWSPSAETLDLSVRADGKPDDRIVALDVASGAVREVYRARGHLVGFVPSATGDADPTPPVRARGIFVMEKDGLLLVPPDGAPICLTRTPGEGITDVQRSTGPKDKVTVFRSNATHLGGKTIRGLSLLHLDRRRADLAASEPDESIVEPLSAAGDLHTVWFSPGGRFVTWANAEAVWFREVEGKPESVVRIAIADESGQALVVKSCRWDATGERLAITAGDRLYVYQVATKNLRLVRKFKPVAKGCFAGQPEWVGSELVVTVYHDLGGQPGK